ncbi:MAG: hypothetical protein ABI231_08435, partial [Candidatus Tumulicola sp.]
DGILDDALRGAVDAAVRLHGGGVRWRTSTRAARSYGLVELPDARGTTAAAAAAAAHGAGAYDSPVIALAVFPAEPEALQPILTALGGSGRPAGVRTCEPCPQGGAIVEWDLERSPAAVVLGVLDVELARFSSGRAAELLTPLPPAWIARIAADGLKAPDISQDRVLETLVERAGLRV